MSKKCEQCKYYKENRGMGFASPMCSKHTEYLDARNWNDALTIYHVPSKNSKCIDFNDFAPYKTLEDAEKIINELVGWLEDEYMGGGDEARKWIKENYPAFERNTA